MLDSVGRRRQKWSSGRPRGYYGGQVNAKGDRTGEGLLCGLYGGTDSASESKPRGNSSRMRSSPYVAIVYVASSRLGMRCEVRQCRDTAGRLLEHKVRGGKCVGALMNRIHA